MTRTHWRRRNEHSLLPNCFTVSLSLEYCFLLYTVFNVLLYVTLLSAPWTALSRAIQIYIVIVIVIVIIDFQASVNETLDGYLR